jgi:hypothetical protein
LCCKTNIHSKSVVLYTVYLPEPRQDELHQLNLSLQGNPESACVVIAGDFNLPTLNWSPDESVLNNTGGSTENNEFCVLMKDNNNNNNNLYLNCETHSAN